MPKAPASIGGMAMTVAQILKDKGPELISVAPHRSLADAAKTMTERRIGAIIVAAPDGSIAGILSERDIVRAVSAHGAEALDHLVSRHMTAKVVTAKEGDSV